MFNSAQCGYDGGDCCYDTCLKDECLGATESTCFDPASTLSKCGSLDVADPDYDYYTYLCR